MNTKALVTMLLLLLCAMIFASEDASDAAEHARKTQELNQLAERFKAETGFTGRINYGYERMRLGSFEGNFSDIPFTTEADTIAFRQACERIVDKILPYSPANRSQLSKSRITKQWGGYTTDYYQQVGGYRVEGAGFIMITYEEGRKRFSIGDNTVELPDVDVSAMISKEAAEGIALSDMNDAKYQSSRTVSIYYTNRGSDTYYLAYFVCVGTDSNPIFGDYFYLIDSMTGRVAHKRPADFIHSEVNVRTMGYEHFNDVVWSNPPIQESLVPMKDVRVVVKPDSMQTDLEGYASFIDVADNFITAKLINSSMKVTCSIDTLSPVSFAAAISDSLNQQDISMPNYSHYTSNVFIKASKHIDGLNHINGNSSYIGTPVNICCFNTPPDYNAHAWGGYSAEHNFIWIRDGRLASTVRHELGHNYVHNVLGISSFNAPDTLHEYTGAMDEAFASYLCGSPTDDSYLPDLLIEFNMAFENSISDSLSLTEDQYTYYSKGRYLASAWWSLRDNSLFPDNDQGVCGVDTLLVAGLGIVRRDIEDNAAYRYKPRYFYNILMNRVDDGSASYSLNTKQNAINKAYASRGFHFTPQVISAGSLNSATEKNMFRVGDPVYVTITNCPQNTPVTVYIVADQDYTDGMSVSGLNTIVHQFSAWTDSQGKVDLTDPVLTAPAVGTYDIIVNIGNDDFLHYAHLNANVRDGFDGLNGPGFTVYDDGVDVVMALDLSGSMHEHTADLQQLTKRFISAMLPGDKVNIFGFNEGSAPNWNSGGFQILAPTPLAQLYTITTSNQTTLINGVAQPTAGGNTDLYIPYYRGYYPFGSPSERSKGMILLSDGVHNPTIYEQHPYNANYSNPHRMNHVSSLINTHYNNNDIACYTMRYGNASSGITNMNNIASWGHGVAYQVPHLSGMSLIVSRLISRLRGNPPNYDSPHVIPENSSQTFQIVVDDNAECFRTTLIWAASGNASYRHFTLTDPLGTIYDQPEVFDGATYKYSIAFPEAGTWIATITNGLTVTDSCSVISEIDSDLRVNVLTASTAHPIDQPFLLQVSVMDYINPVADAVVSATISRGTWEYSINLYDDGNHFDGASNDGVYGNYMFALSETDAYGDFDLSFTVDIPSVNGMRVIRQNLYLQPAQQNSYPAVTRDLHKGWNWVGYPRLQRDDTGTLIDYANVSLLPHLSDIESADGYAEYRNNHWTYHGLESLNSVDGYKLRTNMNDDDTIRLYELGTIIDTLMVHQLQKEEWIWLTYPCYETAQPLEALADVEDKIDYIMAEQWSMKRDDSGNWISDGFIRPYLKYGDSIMVRATSACSFVWNRPLTTPDVSEPQKTSYFTFMDKPDYETLMIESIDGDNDYSEIGVFQNDECIGARVIQAFPIQILAYSIPAEEGGGDLSLMLYSESKGSRMASFQSSSSTNMTIAPEQHGFRSYAVNTDGEVVAPVLALGSNYPNPFNPSTNISFSIPSPAKVKLTVYNVKGQKVKELINDTMDMGKHTVQWDGTDHSNRKVSSGLYFSRLEHDSKSKTIKMMLMK